MAVFSIDIVWLLLVCFAKCRSNEKRVSMKKSGNTDAFWRERRAARRGIKREGEKLAAKRGLIESYVPILTTAHVEKRRKRKPGKVEKLLIIYSKRVYYFCLLKAIPWLKRKLRYKWWKGTYFQVRRQHKLFRTCYAKYHIDEDPSKFHTGAQKATVLIAIILFKCVMVCMVYSAGNGELMNTIARKIVSAIFVAFATLPAAVVLDQMFWRQQRLSNKFYKSAKTVQAMQIKGASLKNSLETLESYFVRRMTIKPTPLRMPARHCDPAHATATLHAAATPNAGGVDSRAHMHHTRGSSSATGGRRSSRSRWGGWSTRCSIYGSARSRCGSRRRERRRRRVSWRSS